MNLSSAMYQPPPGSRPTPASPAQTGPDLKPGRTTARRADRTVPIRLRPCTAGGYVVMLLLSLLYAVPLVFVLFGTTNIGYLWYNLIGCAAVLILAPVLQQTIFRGTEAPAGV